MNNPELQVKKANKDFYDIVGPSYEEIDGRRSEQLLGYVSKKLETISRQTDTDSILDLGCGSGFISRIAKKYFKKRYAIDISYKIVKAIEDKNLHKVTADSDLIPMQDDSLNCVVTFAVLHHCYAYEKMLSEIIAKTGDTLEVEIDETDPKKPGKITNITDCVFEELIDFDMPLPPDLKAEYFVELIGLEYEKIKLRASKFLKTSHEETQISLFANKNIQIAKRIAVDAHNFDLDHVPDREIRVARHLAAM